MNEQAGGLMIPEQGEQKVNHIIGSARTIQTAVLVVEYLRQRCAKPHSPIHPDTIHYEFTNPSADNGYWSASIFVESYGFQMEVAKADAISKMIEVARAFVAGRGEIWA